MQKNNENLHNFYRIELTSYTGKVKYIPSTSGIFISESQMRRIFAEECERNSETWEYLRLENRLMEKDEWGVIAVHHKSKSIIGRKRVKFTWVGPKGSKELLPICPTCGNIVSNIEECIFCHQKFLEDDKLVEYFHPTLYM